MLTDDLAAISKSLATLRAIVETVRMSVGQTPADVQKALWEVHATLAALLGRTALILPKVGVTRLAPIYAERTLLVKSLLYMLHKQDDSDSAVWKDEDLPPRTGIQLERLKDGTKVSLVTEPSIVQG